MNIDRTNEIESRGMQVCRRARAIFLGLAVAAGLVAVLGISLESSWHFDKVDWRIPGDLRKAIELSEAFAQGFGAAAILVTVFIVSQQNRPRIWVAIWITLLSGLLAHGLKAGFVRVRPHSVATIDVIENAPWSIDLPSPRVELPSSDAAAPGLPTDASSVPSRQIVPPDLWDSRQRSFPSGHASTAWGLMIGLSLAFPRGTLMFALLAALASFQRIYVGAHYPSDVFGGLAVACLAAGAVLSLPSAYRNFVESSPDHNPQ